MWTLAWGAGEKSEISYDVSNLSPEKKYLGYQIFMIMENIGYLHGYLIKIFLFLGLYC